MPWDDCVCFFTTATMLWNSSFIRMESFSPWSRNRFDRMLFFFSSSLFFASSSFSCSCSSTYAAVDFFSSCRRYCSFCRTVSRSTSSPTCSTCCCSIACSSPFSVRNPSMMRLFSTSVSLFASVMARSSDSSCRLTSFCAWNASISSPSSCIRRLVSAPFAVWPSERSDWLCCARTAFSEMHSSRRRFSSSCSAPYWASISRDSTPRLMLLRSRFSDARIESSVLKVEDFFSRASSFRSCSLLDFSSSNSLRMRSMMAVWSFSGDSPTVESEGIPIASGGVRYTRS
uniref:Uncharacterized protein n=1 Tax=Anopheles coluzzii TaxID=1518534 RepID=A0A8W7PZS2_ANOCL